MFGTELSQAYDQGTNYEANNFVHFNEARQMEIDHIQHETTNNHSDSSSIQIPPPTQQKSSNSLQNNERDVYDSSAFFRNSVDFQMQNQLNELQEELRLQKQLSQNKSHNENNIIDRFISKKKEVFKLILLSLTILLAFSLHYIVNDTLRNYMANNSLTSFNETMTKIAYPLSVVTLIWCIKVFNK